MFAGAPPHVACLLSSQETRWADIQNTTAKKTQELGTIKLAILNLFQCVSTQLKANLNVPTDDSHRQLTMVEPSQTPSPCPERGAAMTLSCPKGGESPEKSMCSADTLLFTWALSWARGMGRRHQANLSHPRRRSRMWVPVGEEGVGTRQAGAGDEGMQMNPWPRFGFIHPCPELRLTHKRPFWWCRSSRANALLSCSIWLVKFALQKGQQAPLCLLSPSPL